MKILHILEDYSIHSGGIRTVVKELNERLNNIGVKSYILSSKKEDGDNIYLVETNKPWLFSNKWKSTLLEIHNEHKINIIHIHGVWLYPQFIAAKFAFKNNIPFILTPHGMFEPWIWNKGTLKKRLYFNFVTKNVFSKAKKIHGITNDEISNLKKLFKSSDFIEIPNLIDSIQFQNNDDLTFTNKLKYFFYLGRLDSKKGIDILIRAFSKLENNEFMLKIAGPFNDYKIFLDNLVGQLGLNDKVEFLGLVRGEEKVKLYREAFVFIAPSHSEVVGMVNLEAAINKTPVITTYQTGLDRRWNNEGGILINPREEEILNSLNNVLKWSLNDRLNNGKRLYDFVVNNYSWSNRIKDWQKLYDEILLKS